MHHKETKAKIRQQMQAAWPQSEVTQKSTSEVLDVDRMD